MTIKDVLKKGRFFLGNKENAVLNTEVLLSKILRKPKEYLFSHNSDEIEEENVNKFFEQLEGVKLGKPIAYLVNRKEFYGRDFYVDERVLIPRPETEVLIDEVKELIKRYYSGMSGILLEKKLAKSRNNFPKIDLKIGQSQAGLRILDIGTGSGNIAITLALELNNLGISAEITAVDVSSDALIVAKYNYKMLILDNKLDYELDDKILFSKKVNNLINFYQSDLLNGLPEKTLNRGFDIIVCNLPYIGTKKCNFVEENVRMYEPHKALFAGKDGLFLYKKLFDQIKELKIHPNYIIGEYGFKEQEKEIKIMAQAVLKEIKRVNSNKFKIPVTFEEIRFKRDWAGNPRVFIVKSTF